MLAVIQINKSDHPVCLQKSEKWNSSVGHMPTDLGNPSDSTGVGCCLFHVTLVTVTEALDCCWDLPGVTWGHLALHRPTALGKWMSDLMSGTYKTLGILHHISTAPWGPLGGQSWKHPRSSFSTTVTLHSSPLAWDSHNTRTCSTRYNAKFCILFGNKLNLFKYATAMTALVG
jgi:hypothetical protein